MIPATRFDSIAQVATAAKDRARADSAAKDTTAKDTTAKGAAAKGAIARASITRPALAGDTATPVKPPSLQRPIPVQNWVAALDAPLTPGEYRVTGVPKTVVNEQIEILGGIPQDDFIQQALVNSQL